MFLSVARPLGGWLKPGIPSRSRRQEQDRSRVPRKCGGTITKLCQSLGAHPCPAPATLQATQSNPLYGSVRPGSMGCSLYRPATVLYADEQTLPELLRS